MHGNRKAQRARRKARADSLPICRKQQYQLVDGNYSHYPAAYCKRMKGYLTVGLVETHRCTERKCGMLVKDIEEA